MKSNIALIALLASGFMASAQADAIEEGIAKYREMLQDGIGRAHV